MQRVINIEVGIFVLETNWKFKINVALNLQPLNIYSYNLRQRL